MRLPDGAAARRGTGRRAGPGRVGGRDRPPRRQVRGAARRRAGRAAAAPHAARRHRLELEPARPGRAGGHARPVGVPRRLHRRRRTAPARRRRLAGPRAAGRSVAAQGRRHRVGGPLPDAGDRTGVRRCAAGGRRRDRGRDQPVPRLGPRLRRGSPRLRAHRRRPPGLRADPGRAGQPGPGAAARA